MPAVNARKILFFGFILLNYFSNKVDAQPTAHIKSIHLIGSYQIPNALSFLHTTVGGLSGIDYDQANNQYYLISDDRSAINPARYYTAKIFLTQSGIDSVLFTGVNSLLQSNGKVYPNFKQDKFHTTDPEAIRYNPIRKQLVWSSEGERIITKSDTILENPSITTLSLKGAVINTFTIPPKITMQATENGPRQNADFEGITFANNYATLFANMEEPLYEDGPRADTIDNNTYIRILTFNVARRENTHQFAYKLGPVAHPPIPTNAFKVNGVPEILSIGNNKLLVIERSFSTGRIACSIKLFIADLSKATDIKNLQSLKNTDTFTAASKKLLLNMDELAISTDNIEGVTFGPLLPNGHKTLLFISDNNFNPLQQTQLLLFEVNE